MHVSTADSIWAFELGHRAPEIAARLGVEKVRFAPGLLPGPEPAAEPRTTFAPSKEDARAAAALAGGIEAENLRETVQKAAGFWLARRASDRPV